ncbi:Myo-Inositol 2-dehydrogenase [Spiroplasma chinense]|uniref:Myo-Inositol 2-dehydrogenase n=1 Tax=Spiroplasma chinense TaxID=216932 RepID=A0A5B9Y4V9_9MOLU|nr:inositol 2-dehydrogenase [Spiroplasma chinense]QEH61845.1 Myo-Inositol 2-dehydrogenase [Spiroplasma chinense]
MKKMIAGVFGAGRIGKFHVENLLQYDNVEVKTICDVQLDHLIEWNKDKNIFLTKNEDDIFDDKEINAIFIFSSTDQHISQLIKATQNVDYIFMEKPISKSIDATLEAWEIVKSKSKTIQLGFNRRFDPNFKKVKEARVKETIGVPHVLKITSRDPEPPGIDYVKVSGGIFMDMAIHDFDMSRYIVGSDVEEVFVMGDALVNPKIKEAGDIDTAIIQLKFANNALGVIDISREAVYGYDQRLELFGSKGAIIADNKVETSTKLLTKDCSCVDNPLHFFIERYIDAYKNEYETFIEAFMNNDNVICSFEDGLKAELIAEACKKSYETKTVVKVRGI